MIGSILKSTVCYAGKRDVREVEWEKKISA